MFPLVIFTVPNVLHIQTWSGWRDLVFRLTSFAAEPRAPSSLDSVRSFKSSKHATGMFALVIFTVPNILHIQTWSGWGDLNPRPQRPERCALSQAALHPEKYLPFYQS